MGAWLLFLVWSGTRTDSICCRYTGTSLSAAGPFYETDVNQTDASGTQPTNGWPLFDTRIAFSTISGFYDVQQNGSGTNYPWLNQYGWESFISGIPHPTAIVFAFGDNYLDATVKNTTLSDFQSKISFKTGVGEWSYTWSPPNLLLKLASRPPMTSAVPSPIYWMAGALPDPI
jgi:hypothetical protein